MRNLGRIGAMGTTHASRHAEASGAPATEPLRELHLLETLAALEQPAGLSAIAAAADLTTSKTYRILRSLQDRGFVDHAGHSGYRIGSRAVALASMIGPRPAVAACARPYLVALAELAAATAGINLRSGAHRVLVLGVESRRQPLGGAIELGERAPLSTGCSGTVILAHLPEAEARAVLNDRWATPDPARLARIRSHGYDISLSGNHLGMNGVAAPILDPMDGYPLGSMAIAGPERRLPEDTLHRLSQPLMTACEKLSPKLTRLLGRNFSERRSSLDVAVHGLLEQ